MPIILLVGLWRHHGVQLSSWVLQTALCGSYILSLFLLGGWSIVGGYWTRWILAVAFILVAAKSFFNVTRNEWWQYQNPQQLFQLCIRVLVLGFFLWEAGMAWKGSWLPARTVALEFPLKTGQFCVLQGGDNVLINHHYPVDAQRFAIDIVQINSWGFSSCGFMNSKLEDYLIFGATLYSPCVGIVDEAVDGFEDLPPSIMQPEHPLGNYLVISMEGSDVLVLMAHLQKDSLQVKKGDRVNTGQSIARVGNSGNTSQPHLHLQATKKGTGTLLKTAEGIPMTFDGRFLVRNSVATALAPEGIHTQAF